MQQIYNQLLFQQPQAEQERCVYLCVFHAFRDMTLVLVLKVRDGLVLASESRAIVTVKDESIGQLLEGIYDNATKLFSFKNHKYVGILTYGWPYIGSKMVYQDLPEFEDNLQSKRMSIYDFAKNLLDFFREKWDSNATSEQIDRYTLEGYDLNFLVAGFNEGEEHGRVFWIGIPSGTEPKELLINSVYFAEGQPEIVYHLLSGHDHALDELFNDFASRKNFDESDKKRYEEVSRKILLKIPYNSLTLQDSVELAIFLIKTTIDAQRFVITPRGCGGAIDVCTITSRDGLQCIQHKK